MKIALLGICLLLVLVLIGPVRAVEWGDLKGQFLYDGDPPEPAKLRITKDEEECCKHDLVDESLVVGGKKGDGAKHGLKNVVVYLYPARGEMVPVHASYAVEAKQERKLDNLACRFDPRVVLLWKSQSLRVGNSDPIGHNALIDTQKNPPINVTIPSGGSYQHSFPLQEREPVPVSCSIHPWMRGWVLVRDVPYMAVTDKDGRFEIKNLPVGEWEFACWHERASFLTEVERSGKPNKWKRGRVKLQIQPGENDLGVVAVKPTLFRN